ncbi:MAG: ATP-binding protein [Elusimicrobia bacterium]|nr:ATP-binding protein [Elusimicrobiota bacterium]
MNEKEIRQLVAKGEGPCLEFKRTTGELKEGLRTICAFLNSHGGAVLFGVNRKGRYEKLLLERGHAKRRWENLPAEGLTLKDLDRREILRTRELAIQQNRISPDTSRDIGEILDRLGLRMGGVLTQAALIL